MGASMNHRVGDTTGHSEFFDNQRSRAARLQATRIGITVFCGVVLLTLLSYLRSPPLVWGWVILLFIITWWGLYRLRHALDVTVIALADLGKVAGYLKEPHSREEIIQFIEKQVKPDDSMVPEALAALSYGQRTGETVRAAANAAFAKPSSELSIAHYRRTILVLLGLAGTVLFFAIELGNAGILSGDLGTLLPGLRGALASTLAGIAGSIAVGYLASKIDQIIEQSIWEAESLIGGSFSQALSESATDPQAVNEVQLWQLLLGEVRSLRENTEASYKRLGSDVAAHVSALQELSSQLAEIPQLQVPPQLARLQDVVSEFKSGTELLNQSTTRLVDAVGIVGLSVPTKTLNELSEIKESLSEGRKNSEHSLSELGRSVYLTQEALGEVQTSIDSIAPSIRNHLPVVRQEVSGLVAASRGLGVDINALRAATSEIHAQGTDIQESLAVASRQAQQRNTTAEYGSPDDQRRQEAGANVGSGNLGAAANSIVHGIAAIENGAAAVREIESRLGGHTERLASALAVIVKQESTLARISSRLSEMEAVLTWHRRAARAPLMRLLLLPLWPKRSTPSSGA